MTIEEKAAILMHLIDENDRFLNEYHVFGVFDPFRIQSSVCRLRLRFKARLEIGIPAVYATKPSEGSSSRKSSSLLIGCTNVSLVWLKSSEAM